MTIPQADAAQESKTPLTDAAIITKHINPAMEPVVSAGFARNLELALAASQEREGRMLRECREQICLSPVTDGRQDLLKRIDAALAERK